MARFLLLASLAVVVAACSGKSKSPDTTTPPSDGDTGATKCEPGRCLEDISRLIAERRSDARACYDTGRKRDPKLAGGILINFAIDSEGMVGEAEQSLKDGQMEDPEVVACVIKTVRFPPSPAGKTTRAYHRFEFSP